MIKKIKEHFELISLVLVLIVLLKQCGTSSDVSKIKKEVKQIRETTYTKEEIGVELKISGLEAEKRMIQSTDRKMLDVNRQSEIEKEIETLKKKK